MLVQFSIRRTIALMVIDYLGSIALLYGVVRLRRVFGEIPPGLAETLTGYGIQVFPLGEMTTSYLLPTPTVLLVMVLWPLAFITTGVYDGRRSGTLLLELRNVSTAVLLGFVALTGILFFAARGSSRLVLVMFLVGDLLLLCGARAALWLYRRIRPQSRRPRRVVLIVGAGDVGENVAAQFARYSAADLDVIGFLDDDPMKQGAVVQGKPVLGTSASLRDVVTGRFVEDAVLALPLRAHQRLVDVVRELQVLSVRVHIVPDLFELSFPGARLQGFGGIPVLDLGWTGISGWRLLWKRIFDITVGGAALVSLAPLMLVVAALVKFDSKGPVFYRHHRIGRNQRPFEILKFRSMRVDADPGIHERHVKDLIEKNVDLAAAAREGKGTLKIENDTRVTRIGRFIRRASIDELPQLINVLRGEMSLVGPRPPMDYEVRLYKPWHKRRFECPPGCTGLWQVKGRNRVSFDEMVRMDLEYIAQQSVWLDIKLLLQTPFAMLHGKGAG